MLKNQTLADFPKSHHLSKITLQVHLPSPHELRVQVAEGFLGWEGRQWDSQNYQLLVQGKQFGVALDYLPLAACAHYYDSVLGVAAPSDCTAKADFHWHFTTCSSKAADIMRLRT